MRNHAAAHADAAAAEVPRILDHPMVPANTPALIDDQPALDALLATLREAGRFAYDTEFIGEQSFQPRFCVLQVATADRVTLIDALADLDLAGVWALLADPGVEKIVHAGRQDLEPAMRFLGRTPRNIFDVQIASGFAVEPMSADAQPGATDAPDAADDADAQRGERREAEDAPAYPASLGKLVAHYTGGDLGHGLKFSQWDHRPLSDVQKQYAANDVRYLPRLRDALLERIEALGNTAALREELADLEDADLYRFDPLSQKLRAKGVGALGRRKQALLRELVLWRTRVAEAEDLPPRMLIRDDVLVALATTPIESEADLSHVKGLPRPVREDFGDSLLEALQTGMTAPLPPKTPRLPRLTDEQSARVERLWSRMHQRCAKHGIAPGLAVTKREVIAFVRQTTPGSAPKSSPKHSPPSRGLSQSEAPDQSDQSDQMDQTDQKQQLPDSPLLQGWRGHLFGDILRADVAQT